MRNLFALALILPFLLIGSASCEKSKDVIREISDCSSMIYMDQTHGSGVIVTRNGEHYVLTAGHLIDMSVTDVQKGYPEAWVHVCINQDNRDIGEARYYAKVIRFSTAFGGYDLTVLKLRGKNLFKSSAKFTDNVPEKGEELWHVGSPKGRVALNSISGGTFSHAGRIRDYNRLFDEMSLPVDGGCSGGGVFLKSTGLCIGIVLEHNKDMSGMSYIRPTREIRAWAHQVGMEWLVDESLTVPSDEQIAAFPIADSEEVK